MSFRSNVPYFTERILAMRTIQRTESSELIPTGIQFPPFLIIRIFTSCFVKFRLAGYIAVFHTETADIHCPIRNATDRKVQPGRNLRFHIFPTGSDVPTPCSGRITLATGKSGTGQQEDTLVGLHATLSVIDSLGIHQSVCIEEFCGRTECRRTAKILTILQIRTIAHVRLAGIHPPGINT